MNTAFCVHHYFRMNRERVHNRCTYTVETSGYLVPFATEFTSGVECCHDSFESRNFCLWMNTDWNTSSIVHNSNVASRKKCYFDAVTISTHSLVSRVIENFPNEVMKTFGTCCTDVHTWSYSYGFESLKNLDGFGAIISCFFCFVCGHE